MQIFTPKAREAAKEYLIALAAENTNIIAGVLLGSASYGYVDEWSDIDFCVVVDEEDSIEKAMLHMSEGVKAYSPILCFGQLTQRRLQIYLLDNYLELNISFRPKGNIGINKGVWQVVLDKSGKIEMEVENSWVAHQETQKEKAQSQDVHEKVKSYANETWHFLFHCAIAIKRKKYWRTIGELDIVRNRLVELKGLRYAIDTGRYRGVDNLPEHELKIIQMTMAIDTSWEGLAQCLNVLADAIYDELEAQGAERFYSVNRHQAKKYIRKVLSS